MPVVRPTSHDHGTRHTTAHLLYLGLSLCVGVYRENVPCAPCAVVCINGGMPRSQPSCQRFRQASATPRSSVLYREGVPVRRYRQLNDSLRCRRNAASEMFLELSCVALSLV